MDNIPPSTTVPEHYKEFFKAEKDAIDRLLESVWAEGIPLQTALEKARKVWGSAELVQNP